MAKTIWKYQIGGRSSSILMPLGATVLDVQIQNGQPCLWALVDQDASPEHRRFEIVGTGWAIEDIDHERRVYIGTFQQPPMVWHVFEQKEGPF